MACRCRSCFAWDKDRAQRWWELHLPELTGPLTVDDAKAGAEYFVSK